jgi:outer membrane receptor protein involved in Fe transport
VLTPAPNLSATIDYWNIKIDNTIGFVQSDVALQTCVTSGQLCGLIHRDMLGTLWLPNGGFVDGTNLNIGTMKTSGVDVTLNATYRFESYGSLAASFVATWVREFMQQQASGLGSYDCAGLYGEICGEPMPRWRNVLTTTWNTPWNWTAGLRWRYFDSVAIDASSSNSVLSGPFEPVVARIGAQNYFDLFGQWNIGKNFTLRGGVNNVVDHDPPLTASQGPPFGNGNTFPQVYDALGRNLFVNVQVRF